MREKETEIFETIFYPNTAGSESSSITGFLQVFSVTNTGLYRSNRYERRQTQGANLPAGQAIHIDLSAFPHLLPEYRHIFSGLTNAVKKTPPVRQMDGQR
jgi:hypothetical protein